VLPELHREESAEIDPNLRIDLHYFLELMMPQHVRLRILGRHASGIGRHTGKKAEFSEK
jgi:hypothetical protein